ncbi:hypothetical protein MUK42_32932 [Musa troglodytarum]|uniref:Uncharacterized protein n=1 Tax=Musa troglodytarum TaxID=320322 RepID=A0A9E7GCZ0_9LILI|nr:hypothetical protein MUK42_32932 [Musa troglodytarum]
MTQHQLCRCSPYKAYRGRGAELRMSFVMASRRRRHLMPCAYSISSPGQDCNQPTVEQPMSTTHTVGGPPLPIILAAVGLADRQRFIIPRTSTRCRHTESRADRPPPPPSSSADEACTPPPPPPPPAAAEMRSRRATALFHFQPAGGKIMPDLDSHAELMQQVEAATPPLGWTLWRTREGGGGYGFLQPLCDSVARDGLPAAKPTPKSLPSTTNSSLRCEITGSAVPLSNRIELDSDTRHFCHVGFVGNVPSSPVRLPASLNGAPCGNRLSPSPPSPSPPTHAVSPTRRSSARKPTQPTSPMTRPARHPRQPNPTDCAVRLANCHPNLSILVHDIISRLMTGLNVSLELDAKAATGEFCRTSFGVALYSADASCSLMFSWDIKNHNTVRVIHEGKRAAVISRVGVAPDSAIHHTLADRTVGPRRFELCAKRACIEDIGVEQDEITCSGVTGQ